MRLSRRAIASYLALIALAPWLAHGLVVASVWNEVDLTKHLPIGIDFVSFYTASVLALAGDPAAAYVRASHQGVQRALFDISGYAAFFYPPMYLMVCAPLALAPFFVSLALWLGATFAACAEVLRRLAPASLGYLPIIAFPGVFMNVIHGQNAFLTTALMGGALLALERRPLLAGVCFGALACKPQFGVLVPLFLLAHGRWRTILSAGFTVGALAWASVLVFGVETWRRYFDIAPEAQRALDERIVGDEKMQSVFAMLRTMGVSLQGAYVLQIFTALLVGGVLIYLVRRSRNLQATGALMVTGAMLTTPFMLRYDLMLLLIPLAWLARDSQRAPLSPREEATALLAFLVPLVPLEVALHLRLVVAPLAIAALFAVIARRILISDPAPLRPHVLDGAMKKGEPESSPCPGA